MTKRVRGLPLLCVCALCLGLVGVGACGRTRALENDGNSAGSGGILASAGRGGAGAGGAGSSGSSTAGSAGVPVSVDCKVVMATEGFVSLGYESDAAGDGCTVDGFLDADCEAGTPNFTACLGGSVDDLLDVYAACFTDFEGAQAIVSCYADFMDETDTLVDCSAAHAACSKP